MAIRASTTTGNLTKTSSTWLRFLLIIVVVLGICFRVVDLDRKVYWYDEGFTSLRAAGYTVREVYEQTLSGQVISVADFRQYLGFNPEKDVFDTAISLAMEEPQHPPLYYVLTRFWVQWFGNSVAVIRSLTVLMSLLVLPCAYWLCLELFKSPLTGWVATALIAVSPFHVVYAQEARPYSLWTVTILLASAALLRAYRRHSVVSWGLYAIALALSLYTFLFSVLVAISHGIYLFAAEGWRMTKSVRAYLLASLVAGLAYLPWVLVVVKYMNKIVETTAWMAEPRTLQELIYFGAFHVSSIFFNSTRFDNYVRVHKFFFLPFCVVLVGYGFYFVCRRSKRVWLFLVTLFGVTASALLLPDLITGGNRSTQSRFLIPCYLSIQLTVAYLLGTQISLLVRSWRQKLWQLLLVAVIAFGIISSARIAQAEVTWNRQINFYYHQIARTINQATQPLVVVSDYLSPPYLSNANYLFSFSYLLDSSVKLMLVGGENIPQIPNGFSTIFLYHPALQASDLGFAEKFPVLQSELERQHYTLEPVTVSEPVQLWKLKAQ